MRWTAAAKGREEGAREKKRNIFPEIWIRKGTREQTETVRG